ncbi:MAG: FHA domain-containing protein, partial [Deltaproteobacteria bacterium]
MTAGFAVSVLMPDGSEHNINVPNTGSLTVGRDPTCHIVLPSPSVSRIHLRVERSPDGVRVMDQSSNGTTFGNEPLSAFGRELTSEALHVGPYVLKIAPLADAGFESGASPELRRRIHRSLLDHLDLASLDGSEMDAPLLRPR